MAVYKCKEYFEEYPNRIKSKGVFDKFSFADKNLHEMSLSEVNEITSTWGNFAIATANKMRKEIKLYYDWLSEKGFDVDTDMYRKMNIPIKNNEYLIYSTDRLRYYWCKSPPRCTCCSFVCCTNMSLKASLNMAAIGAH